jgi:hypothetical protein
MSNDEWDTGQPERADGEKPEDKYSGEFTDKEITLINTINEGGWSIQQLAETTEWDEDEIRSFIEDFPTMFTGEILDEKNPDVYANTTPGTQAILDELDAIPTGGSTTTVVTPAPVNDNFWEVEQDCVTACSKAPKSVDVFMNITSRRKAMLYMKWAGPREWLAYLVGEVKDGKYYITDLYLPDQRTSSTLVDKVDNEEFNNVPIVGVIHSHHEMGAGDANKPSFSGHDDAFINSNHNLSLLAGKSGNGFQIVGLARVKTPCDSLMQVKANVKSMIEDPEGDKAMKDEFLEKTQTQTNSGYGYANAYNGGRGNAYRDAYPAVVGGKRTYTVDSRGIVNTRQAGFHFTK